MQKLLWIDLEMTGLDVEKEVIIEAAAIVTDKDLNPVDTYQTVIKQDQKYIDAMDDWNTTHHKASGLTDQIPNGKDPKDAEAELIQFIKKHFGETPAILAGNSISQDRKFIDKYMTELEKILHYRMLDVSSWKLVFKDHYQKEYKKNNTHRALDDIKESINELKHYMSFIAQK